MSIILFGAVGWAGGCKSEKKDVAETKEVVVCNFEQWAPDFQLIRLINNFGRVTQNDNVDYVKSGKFSAKLQPLGSMTKAALPMMFVPLSSALFEFSYSDFSRVTRVTAHLYNAQNDVRQVAMGLVTNIQNIDAVTTTADEFKDVQPGWNELTYIVDLSILNLTADIHEAVGVYFKFYRANSRDIEAAPVYYLDDLKLELSDTDNEIEDYIDQQPYEICDFEQLYENYVISVDCPKPEICPDAKAVFLADYGVPSKDGRGRRALRILYKPGDVPRDTWPKVIISEKLIKTAASKLTDDELAMPYAALCYDVYNNTDGPRELWVDAFNSLGVPYTRRDTIPKGEWRTIILPLNRIYDKNTREVYNNVQISYAEYIGKEEEFFVDNYRFVTDYRTVAYNGYDPSDVYGK